MIFKGSGQKTPAKTVTNNLPVLAADFFNIKGIMSSSDYSFFNIHPKNSSPISP